MLNLEKIENLQLLKSSKLKELKWLNHAFTTKVGGCSKNVYASLNLYCHDETEFNKALENRKLLAKAMCFDPLKMVFARQVHGKQVYLVNQDDIGKGSLNHNEAIAETDALITNLPETPLILLYADCLPILIADKKNKAIGVVHAGWKGTAQNILVETLKAMELHFNSQKENFIIAFGIGISKSNFEIGNDAKEKLSLVNFSDNSFEVRNEKIYADLIEINTSQALNFGVPKENIDYNKDLCSYENSELFYSYRRDNKITGRHGAIIFITDVNNTSDN